MKTYTVKYRMWEFSNERSVDVTAMNKADAFDKATYEVIPDKEGTVPYSSWVESVTFSNGKTQMFNTCEGLAY